MLKDKKERGLSPSLFFEWKTLVVTVLEQKCIADDFDRSLGLIALEVDALTLTARGQSAMALSMQ